MNNRKALIIGIDNYPSSPLSGCVNDAKEVANILERNHDGSPNFHVKSMLGENHTEIKKADLSIEVRRLFSGDPDIALLYFSGHGGITNTSGFIAAYDSANGNEGLPMDEILTIANESKAKNKIIILDCCCSGNVGSPEIIGGRKAFLADGVTILTACRPTESAIEIDGQGVFTSLLVDALRGTCADLLGNISPGSIYAFIDRALGPWEQRPIFKTNISRFISLRTVKPPIDTNILRKITEYFPNQNSKFSLDPSYEFTNPDHEKQNVVIFKNLQKMVSVGLVKPIDEEHMYFAAMNSGACKLTAMGVQYWKLAKSGRL